RAAAPVDPEMHLVGARRRAVRLELGRLGGRHGPEQFGKGRVLAHLLEQVAQGFAHCPMTSGMPATVAAGAAGPAIASGGGGALTPMMASTSVQPPSRSTCAFASRSLISGGTWNCTPIWSICSARAR